jgi:hypothetical protein
MGYEENRDLQGLVFQCLVPSWMPFARTSGAQPPGHTRLLGLARQDRCVGRLLKAAHSSSRGLTAAICVS